MTGRVFVDTNILIYAMIISAASKGNAQILWTEDLSHGQSIEGIEIVNPLL